MANISRRAQAQIDSTNWSALKTAYGPVEDLNSWLVQLYSDDADLALAACGELSNHLAHQGGVAPDALLPAFDILIERTETAPHWVLDELMMIFHACAICAGPNAAWADPDHSWQTPLRDKMKDNRTVFERIAGHRDPDIKLLASDILDRIDSFESA